MSDSPSPRDAFAECPGNKARGGLPSRRRLIVLAGLLAVLYLGSVTGQWWATPDSALYLGLAKSLAAGEGYRFNGQVSSTVTPGLPLILAGLSRLFGEGYWAPNLFVAACGLAGVLVIYWGFTRLVDRRMALAVAICCGLSHTYFFSTHVILTDIVFVLLFWTMLAAMLGGLRGSGWWLVVAAILAAAALTVRAPGVLAIGAIGVGLLFDRSTTAGRPKRVLGTAAIFVAAIVTVVLLYCLGRSVAQQTPLYAAAAGRLAGTGVAAKVHRLLQGLRLMPYPVAELFTSQRFYAVGVLALLLAATGAVVQCARRQAMPTVAVGLYLLSLAAIHGDWKVPPRYVLPAQPLMFYLAIDGALWSVRILRRWFRREADAGTLAKTATVFAIVVAGANAPRLLRNAVYYTWLGHTPGYHEAIGEKGSADLLELADRLRELCPLAEPTFAPQSHVRILHYRSGRRVRPILPEEAAGVPLAIQMRDQLGDIEHSAVVVTEAEWSGDELAAAISAAFNKPLRAETIHRGRYLRAYRLTVSAPTSAGEER